MEVVNKSALTDDSSSSSSSSKKRVLTPIIPTTFHSNAKKDAKKEVTIRFHIDKALENRIKSFSKPLQDRAIMPVFIVSHFQNKEELDEFNLGLQFEKSGEHPDKTFRVTFLVVNKFQAKVYVNFFIYQILFHPNSMCRYKEYLEDNQLEDIIILSLPIDFDEGCDAVLETIKCFSQYFNFSHVWLADHHLDDIRGILLFLLFSFMVFNKYGRVEWNGYVLSPLLIREIGTRRAVNGFCFRRKSKKRYL